MRPPTDDTSARQPPGEPSPVPSRGGNRTSRPASKHVAEIDGHLVDLLNRSTQELRLAWRELHRTVPPQGLSRDLLILGLPLHRYGILIRACGINSTAENAQPIRDTATVDPKPSRTGAWQTTGSAPQSGHCPTATQRSVFGHLGALAESCLPYTNMRRARRFGGDPCSIDSLAELDARHIETS